MGNARTEAAKHRRERKRARKTAAKLRSGEPVHPTAYAAGISSMVTETKTSTHLRIKATGSSLEPLRNRNRSSYATGAMRTRQKLRTRDREPAFGQQQDLPIWSQVSPTGIPQLKRFGPVTLEGGEQRGQPNDLNLELSGFSSRMSQIASESFPRSDEMPNFIFQQPTKSWGERLSRRSIEVEGKVPMVVPLQSASRGKVNGGVFVMEGGSHGPGGPSSDYDKFPGVVKPKKQQHKKKRSKVSARDYDPARTSTGESLAGGLAEDQRAGMLRDGWPLVPESSEAIVERSVGHDDDRTGNFNTVSKHAELSGAAESSSRKRVLDLDAELSTPTSTVWSAHIMAPTANNKPRGRRAGPPPRPGSRVNLYADDDKQPSLPSRLTQSGLCSIDTAEYSTRRNRPVLRSDNAKRHASLVGNRAPRTLILPVPQPTEAYLLQADQPIQALNRPRDVLLILDLNGTLLHRKDRSKSQNFVARPHTEEFLQYLLSKFSVMIWSSATPASVTSMCRKLFSEEQRGLLVAEWGRNKLGLTPEQYRQKVQVYKQLEKVWDSDLIAASHPGYSVGGRWDQTNTILLDDSALKASAQPHNHISVPEFTGGHESEGRNSIFNQVMGYLEAIILQQNVSSYIRKEPFKVAHGWNTWSPPR